uniref:Uncharacterized protein n=1 Tax=Physcomitrium patens TaxID=3218 RepID=A0A2K1L435_PHYPA|nr:hypothetical protein PHYPA_003574 [Physcomitrium patens]
MLASGYILAPELQDAASGLWAGKPAMLVRLLTTDEIVSIPQLADIQRELAQEHAQEFFPCGTAYLEVEKLREKQQPLRRDGFTIRPNASGISMKVETLGFVKVDFSTLKHQVVKA